MLDNTQSRKWLITINNPADFGMTHEEIIEKVQLFSPSYACMADEIGASGTYHTHVFLYSSSPIRFGTVKRRFPPAHIDKATGSAAENRDYIRKEGKWEKTEKVDTRIDGSFWELGTCPSEKDEKSPKMAQLLQDIEAGHSTREIIVSNPNFAFKSRDIDILRETLNNDDYRYNNRNVTVSYIYGASGTGKTSGIYARHPSADICRITDYGGKNGVKFDAYHGQSILVFEEFHSEIPISAMLNYLDVYPLMLPARYNDRVACYTTVYITSNIPLNEQYRDVQRSELETWNAFCRRIHKIIEYRKGGITRELKNEKN